MAGLRTLELRKRNGELVEVAAVARGITDATAETRGAILALPDKLADQLAAEQDAHRVHQLLTEHLEQVLLDLATRLSG